jgi:translation initiation factor IF-2
VAIRVYAIAKEMGVASKDVIAALEKMGVTVKSHSSSISEEIADTLRKQAPPSKAGKVREKTVGKKPTVRKKPGKRAPVKRAAKAAVEKKPRERVVKSEAAVKKGPRKQPAAKRPPAAVVEEKPREPVAPVKAAPKIESEVEAKTAEKKRVELPVNVRQLADVLDISPQALMGKLIHFGVMANINQDLDAETVEIIGHEYGQELEVIEGKAPVEQVAEEEEGLVHRAPVVTLMGHIDHGKTSLLDAIRESRIVAKESGGITQHIGAYEIELPHGKITFLDTPGHETFTAMRARGANITDIAVLVIAADDGVMLQTREALDHARAAKVPIVVAINTVDKTDASPNKVKRQLIELGLAPEELGGETICCDVSAMTKQGLSHLLEMLLLQAEMMELKANPDAPASAVVIEAKMDRGRGPVATMLMKKGTLRVGDAVVCGLFAGKVKALFNYLGRRVTEVGPSQPVEVLGLDGVPQPGDELSVVGSEKQAKKIIEARRLKEKLGGREVVGKMTLEELFSKIEEGKAKELKLILKGDVQGSVEALSDALKKLSTDKVVVNIIRCAVGDVGENDVMLASASNAVVIGFHTRIDLQAKELSRREGVEIKLYDVIYKAIDDVRKAMEGLLEPTIKETILGRAEVRQVFRTSKNQRIAGSFVLEGRVVENAKARVIREEKIIHEGAITSLKRFKDQVREVKTGLECGIRLENISDLNEGDIIEVYRMEKVAAKL